MYKLFAETSRTHAKKVSISIASANVRYEDLVACFLILKEQCEELEVLNTFQHANRVYNMDEIPFQLSPKDVKVLTVKNTQYNMMQTACEGKKNVSVLVCASAVGTMMP